MRDRLRPVRVLVVDDSAVMRKLLPAVLTRDPEIEVVATAVDGVVGLRKLARFKPDVVTLDLEMPRMDGLDVLREMVASGDAPVVVVSAYTPRDAALTATALSMGAVDVVAKPADVLSGGLAAMAEELAGKIRAVAGRRWRRPVPAASPAPLRAARPPAGTEARRVVAVAASTGGPAALAHILPRLPGDLAAAVVVVQHMPEGFTEMLAQRLNQSCALEVREAKDGEPLRHGVVLVAPGGRHLRLRACPSGAIVLLDRGPAVGGHRPSADLLFRSVAEAFGARSVAVVLTGMGEDGAQGARAVRDALGHTVVQDEESSVVYGMPRAVVARGAADEVLPLEKIPEAVVREVLRQKRVDAGPAPAARARVS